MKILAIILLSLFIIGQIYQIIRIVSEERQRRAKMKRRLLQERKAT